MQRLCNDLDMVSGQPQPHDVHLVDEYLAAVGQPHRDTLTALRGTIRSVIPRAEECISYGMPTFVLDGKGVAAYAAFTNHCSYFPMSSGVLTAAGALLDTYSTSKGALRFPPTRSLPTSIVRRLIGLRLAELSNVRNGVRLDYFDDGTVKAKGRMRDGELDGSWSWFRRDGSLMRTGQFDRGEQVGTWTTWDQEGRMVRESRFRRPGTSR